MKKKIFSLLYAQDLLQVEREFTKNTENQKLKLHASKKLLCLQEREKKSKESIESIDK